MEEGALAKFYLPSIFSLGEQTEPIGDPSLPAAACQERSQGFAVPARTRQDRNIGQLAASRLWSIEEEGSFFFNPGDLTRRSQCQG